MTKTEVIRILIKVVVDIDSVKDFTELPQIEKIKLSSVSQSIAQIVNRINEK